jgi:hypothetical protein
MGGQDALEPGLRNRCRCFPRSLPPTFTTHRTYHCKPLFTTLGEAEAQATPREAVYTAQSGQPWFMHLHPQQKQCGVRNFF